MTKADTDKKDLITNPTNYFAEQRRTLDERLNEIKMDKSVEQKIAGDVTLKIARDKVLGLFKIGDLANALFKLNDDIADKLKLAKKDTLLQGSFEKSEENEAAVTQLQSDFCIPVLGADRILFWILWNRCVRSSIGSNAHVSSGGFHDTIRWGV